MIEFYNNGFHCDLTGVKSPEPDDREFIGARLLHAHALVDNRWRCPKAGRETQCLRGEGLSLQTCGTERGWGPDSGDLRKKGALIAGFLETGTYDWISGFRRVWGCSVEPKRALSSAPLHCSLLSMLIVSEKLRGEILRNKYEAKERTNLKGRGILGMEPRALGARSGPRGVAQVWGCGSRAGGVAT